MNEPTNCIDMADADQDGMGDYFASLPIEEVRLHALRLYYDAARLRRELDDARGVIR